VSTGEVGELQPRVLLLPASVLSTPLRRRADRPRQLGPLSRLPHPPAGRSSWPSPSAGGGFFSGSPSALVRARWAHATRNARELHTAYALESTLDEIPFVFGPVIVTFLSTQVHPAAGLVLPIVLGLAGGAVAQTRARRTWP